jgi:hypothetical protein
MNPGMVIPGGSDSNLTLKISVSKYKLHCSIRGNSEKEVLTFPRGKKFAEPKHKLQCRYKQHK